MSFEVVVMAASAGGLAALGHVLAPLPESFPIPIAIVQHIQAGHVSLLSDILGRKTALEVTQVAEREPLLPGKVYLAPPGRHIVLVPGPAIDVLNTPPVHFLRPCADVLFESAAEVFGPGVIGVILSGSGSDGAAGAVAIRMSGGVVIAQDSATATFPGMPEAAVAARGVDFIVPLDAIAAQIIELTGATLP